MGTCDAYHVLLFGKPVLLEAANHRSHRLEQLVGALDSTQAQLGIESHLWAAFLFLFFILSLLQQYTRTHTICVFACLFSPGERTGIGSIFITRCCDILDYPFPPDRATGASILKPT